MDDLNQQISQLLSDPNSMRQLQNVMSSLGLGGGASQGPWGPWAGASKAKARPRLPLGWERTAWLWRQSWPRCWAS